MHRVPGVPGLPRVPGELGVPCLPGVLFAPHLDRDRRLVIQDHRAVRSVEVVPKPRRHLANERASELTRAERGSRGPRERACRGVRGAKPLGVIKDG
jgi:hypothetical protein